MDPSTCLVLNAVNYMRCGILTLTKQQTKQVQSVVESEFEKTREEIKTLYDESNKSTTEQTNELIKCFELNRHDVGTAAILLNELDGNPNMVQNVQIIVQNILDRVRGEYLKPVVQDVNETVVELRRTVEELRNNIETLRVTDKLRNDLIETLRNELNQSTFATNEQEEHNSTQNVRSQLQLCEVQCNSLHAIIRTKDKRIAFLETREQDLRKLETDISDLTRKNEECKAYLFKVREVLQQANVFSVTDADLADKVQTIVDKIENKELLQLINKKTEDAYAKLADVKRQIEEHLMSSPDDSNATGMTDRQASPQHNTTNEVDKLQTEVEALQAQKKLLEKDKQALEVRNYALGIQNADIETKVNEAQTHLQNMESELKDKQEEVNKWFHSNVKLVDKSKVLNTEILTLDQRKTEIATALTNTEGTLSDKTNELTNIKATLSELSNEYNLIWRQKLDMELRMQQMKQEYTDLEQGLEEYKKIFDLERTNARSNFEATKLTYEGEIADLLRKKQGLSDEIGTMKDKKANIDAWATKYAEDTKNNIDASARLYIEEGKTKLDEELRQYANDRRAEIDENLRQYVDETDKRYLKLKKTYEAEIMDLETTRSNLANVINQQESTSTILDGKIARQNETLKHQNQDTNDMASGESLGPQVW